VSSRRPRAPRYTLTFHPAVEDDLAALGAENFDAARTVLDDLAAGRVTGKHLGVRSVSGDLRGCARVKFDVPDQRPQRFRVVYRETADVREVVAIGQRDEHTIYRAALRRLQGGEP
jgi:hypothetical protein